MTGSPLPEENKPPDPETLSWSARVWSMLSAVECAGVLLMALRYDPRDSLASGDYIDRMSLLPWLSLGEPLQHDIARALLRLRTRFSH